MQTNLAYVTILVRGGTKTCVLLMLCSVLSHQPARLAPHIGVLVHVLAAVLLIQPSVKTLEKQKMTQTLGLLPSTLEPVVEFQTPRFSFAQQPFY